LLERELADRFQQAKAQFSLGGFAIIEQPLLDEGAQDVPAGGPARFSGGDRGRWCRVAGQR
jgi:hypothetical protein